MLWLVIIILLIILLIGSVPTWPYSREWGYSPAGILAAVVLVLILLWIFGVISINTGGGSTSPPRAPAVTGSPTR
jgi:hypothetical protein